MSQKPRMPEFNPLTVVALSWLVLAGCGPGGPRFFDVQGHVTFEGDDVATGDIVFTPQDPRIAPEAGKIRNGRFTARLREGTHRVEITALAIDGKTPILMGSPLAENFIPARYNERSELTAEVSERGNHDFKFQLHAEPVP